MKRISKYDNIKALLIICVVFGHLATPYKNDSHLLRSLTIFIYMFHMPAFIFLSGLFHKKASLKKAGLYFIYAYVLKFILFLTKSALGLSANWDWTHEASVPWYLIVIAEYEILFILFEKLDKRLILGLSIIISLLSGYIPINDFFCLDRAMSFLPFFTVGYLSNKKKLLKLNTTKNKILGCGMVIFAAACCSFWKFYYMRGWFTGRRTYEYLSSRAPMDIYNFAWLIKAVTLLISFGLIYALIMLIPNKRIKGFTYLGERTFQIYYWHRPLCYLIYVSGLYPEIHGSSPVIADIFIILTTLLISYILSISPKGLKSPSPTIC